MMKSPIWNTIFFYLFITASTTAQVDCLPLQGNIKYSHKFKGKIGFDGKLYIPTTHGLISYDGNKVDVIDVRTRNQEIANNALRSIYFSKDSVVWITYHDGGFSRITRDSIQHFINDGGPSDFLCFDVKEHQGILYMGTNNGLYPYENGNFQNPINLNNEAVKNLPPGKKLLGIRSFKARRNDPNSLWLFGHGLYSYDLSSKELKFYKIPYELLEDFGNREIYNQTYLILDLLETQDDLYLTTWGGGIMQIDKATLTWKKYLSQSYRDPLPFNENIFFEMIPYNSTSFLVGSDKALFKFDMVTKIIAPFTFPGQDFISQGDVRLSQVADKVIINDYRNACLYEFDHNAPSNLNFQASVVISDVKLDGISQNKNNYFFPTFPSTFKKHQRNITIEYKLIEPFNSDNRRYEYRLNEANTKWINQNDATSVNFSNLSGGNYSFQVRIRHEDNSYSYSKSFDFSIEKYYYEQWWFWLLSISSLLLIFASILYLKWNQKKKELALEQKHNRELARLEMSALRAQMNPHFLFNSLNSIKNFALTKGPKETAAYLTKFSHLIRLILQNSKSPMVNLKDELDALKLYIEIESLRFEHKFKFEFNIDKGLMVSGVQIPPLILQPYVENAIWHGLMHKKDGIGELRISVKDLGNSIQCMIEDNGIGRAMAQKIKKEKVYGKQKSLGMDITGSRIELTNKIYNINTEVAIIDLYDKDNQASGTRVLIKIPKSEMTYR